jgi:hypothetical protein
MWLRKTLAELAASGPGQFHPKPNRIGEERAVVKSIPLME